MNAIGYVRVSTNGQTDGVGLETQEAKIMAWCAAHDYQLAQVHVDAGLSGSKASNRPGLQQALTEACEQPGAALVVYSLSRLARSTKDAISIAERLEKAGADLVSLSEQLDTTSAAGKMVFRLLAVLSEFERDLVSERTKAALMYKASKGERIGEVPYGFHLAADGVKLLADEAEQQTLKTIRRWRQDGRSWQRIADRLNERGIHSKRGNGWSWQTVRKLKLLVS